MKPHPLSETFPVMGPDELADLAADIKAHGLRDPVVLHEGLILDGRNRWAACKLAKVRQVPTVPYEGDDPLGFVVSVNLHRRHLTAVQRAEAALKLANMRQGERTDLEPSAHAPKVSQSQAAGLMGVGVKTVQAVKTVQEKGTPEEVAKVQAGEVAVSRAAKEITGKEKDIRDAAKADPDRYQPFADRLDAGEKAAAVHKAFARERGRATTKGEALKDATGYEVPGRLRDLFGDPWLMQCSEALEGIHRDTLKSMHGKVTRKGPAYAFLLCGDILKAIEAARNELEIAASHLAEGRPHAVHRACEGKGCKDCRNAGWLPRYRFKELKAEGKA